MGYPAGFVNSIRLEFTTAQANEGYEIIILPCFFEIKKKLAFAEMPYCLKKESSSKQFIKNCWIYWR